MIRHRGMYELRASRRMTRSDPVIFRTSEGADPQMGWMLESSGSGFAFACRPSAAPGSGSLLLVELDLTSGGHTRELAEVRRVTRVHDDLHVIGCKLRPASEAQQRSLGARAEIEPKPPNAEAGRGCTAGRGSERPGATGPFRDA